MAKSIAGRTVERALLDRLHDSGRAEMLALYGRRRVGKTYLVRNHLRGRAGTYLEVTGTKDGPAALQRRRFKEAVEEAFVGGPLPELSSWEDALGYLTTLVEQRAAARPDESIVLFFDELPWLATPKARLLEAIDYYWNRRLSQLPQVKLVLCGSAASWMLRRIVHAKGGLHNRITHQLRLEPFTLAEAQTFLQSRRVRLRPVELMELYMALGGVPYYLGLVDRGRSVSEIVGQLCFERDSPLQSEFTEVFASLFDQHEDHRTILRTLAKKREGLTRTELMQASGLSSGGSLNRRLHELEEAGFIGRIEPFGNKKKNAQLRVVDELSLFHLRWIEPAPKGVLARGGAAHWRSRAQTPAYRAWTGYAFESLCLKHAKELMRALDIDNLVTALGSWRYTAPRGRPDEQGAQVDLLFERRDGVINLCELKFAPEPFVITKAYARELKRKLEVFEARTKTKRRVVLTLVCPLGLKKNAWSEDLVEQVVDARALLLPGR